MHARGIKLFIAEALLLPKKLHARKGIQALYKTVRKYS